MAPAIIHLLKDFCPPAPKYLPEDYPDLTGKTVLITGSSAGIGKETSRLLLSKNATVVMVNRNKTKTEAAINEIKTDLLKDVKCSLDPETLSKRIILVSADLSDLTTIKPAAIEIKTLVSQLDIVILNAGLMQPPNGSKSKQGYELQMGTNVLAHQLLLDLVAPLISKPTLEFTPRVVILSSLMHLYSPPKGGLSWDFNDASKASTAEIYGQSKAANIYMAYHFGKLHPEIISLSVHPGYLHSDLQRYYPGVAIKVMKRVLFPTVYGAYTELFAALSPDVTIKDTGRYIGPWGNFREVRADIKEGFTDGTCDKFIEWLETEIEPYK